MKNSQLLPFERNRYYAGKALTSTDFAAEQLYVNNKRRFMNYVMYGTGVVCGLNVINLDDASLLVESGVAIDSEGREIVIESSVVKKLSAIAGFEELKGERAYLCIRYKEEDVHPVYCASAGTHCEESEYEFNRIDEGYELFLVDVQEEDKRRGDLEEEFLYEKVLLDNENYKLKLRVPSVVSKEVSVKIVLEAEKKSSYKGELSFYTVFQMPAFTNEQGEHTLEVQWDHINLKKGESAQRCFWVNADSAEYGETSILSRQEDVEIIQGGRRIEMEEDISLQLQLVELTPEELATREIGKTNLEIRSVQQKNILLKLAEISLKKVNGVYVFQKMREQGVKTYIATPGEIYRRSRYLSYFKEADKVQKSYVPDEENIKERVEFSGNPVQINSGRIEVPLKMNMKKGDVCYSEEIMHGLGKGNVYVEVGIDYQDEAPDALSHDNTIYGDAEMFGVSDEMKFECAVKVMKDRGSFQVALRLLGEQKSVIAGLNWVAMRFDKEEPENMRLEDMRLVPKCPTVQLHMRERYFFEVEFEKMQPCPLSYELTEEDSGEIEEDGVYRAPAKEGVYEIKIYCTDHPVISTYVYAIVQR